MRNRRYGVTPGTGVVAITSRFEMLRQWDQSRRDQMVLNRHFLYGYCIWHFYAPAQEAAGKRDALAHDRCVLPPLCDSSRVCAGGCHAYKYTGATHPRAAALKLCESKLKPRSDSRQGS